MDFQPSRQASKKKLYQRIAEKGIVSKAELLSDFNLTTSTMNRLLEELAAKRLIVESGFGPSSGGRKPILYEINPEYGFFLGLEISRFYSSLGLFDMKMNPKSMTRWRMDEDMTPENFVSHVARQIRMLLHDHGIDRQQMIGIGVGAVGPLDRERGMIVKPLYFRAKGWKNVPICSMLEEATGIPAMLDNGANTALLGEHWAMRGQQAQHMIYVHAGVGLRSAMMSHGKIIYGSVDMEGSIGQMIIHTDGPRLQEDGNYGSLEAYVSVQALEKQARFDAKSGGIELANRQQASPGDIHYDTLLRELSLGNAYALDLFMRAARHFGIGLANLINVFHPEIIILGGTLVNSDERFFQTSTEIACKNTYYYPEYVPAFSKGLLREDAVATGAALMMWKAMEV